MKSMSLVSLTNLTKKQRNLDCLAGYDGDLVDILTELQGLSFAVGTGAGADTNIAVTGITTSDTLAFVLEVTADTAALTDRTATSSITSAGNIQCTASTAGNQLIIVWYNKS